jgi:ACS family hexuronate transporter-like MFS transporter
VKKHSQFRWWVASLLFAATVINYVDRQVLSLLAPLLRDEFKISNTEYSRIVFAFLVAYMVMQGVSGKLMDRLGTRVGLALTVSFWSVAAVLHATVRSAIGFGVFRFLLGAGEAGNWPGAVKTISERFPARERALATGFFNSGSIVGALLAAPAVPWIAVRYGWRSAFVVTGALGFLWLVPWLALSGRQHLQPAEFAEQSGAREALPAGGQAPVVAPARWRDLLAYRQVWGLFFCRMFADPIWWFYVFWLPEYLARERQFTLAMIGHSTWMPFFTAGLGSFAGGLVSGRLVGRGWPPVRARKTVMIGSAVVMLAGTPTVWASSALGALALISAATFGYSCWATNVLSLPADLFPSSVVASVSGMSGTGGALGGMLVTLITGALLDRFSYTPVFIMVGFMAVAAGSVLLVLVSEAPASIRLRAAETAS